MENTERDGNTRPPDLPLEKPICSSGSITINKASGSNGNPVELFQILKDDAVKVLHSICQQIWKTRQWPGKGLEKVSFHSNPKERQCKECSNYYTIALISQIGRAHV